MAAEGRGNPEDQLKEDKNLGTRQRHTSIQKWQNKITQFLKVEYKCLDIEAGQNSVTALDV